MEKQILEILERYRYIPSDFNFVKDILLILRNYYHCEEQLEKIMVYKYSSLNKKKSKFNGFYDSSKKRIYIDISSYDNYNNMTQFEKNIGILEMILHEFAHAMQCKKSDNNVFLDILLYISKKVSFKDKTGDIHDYIPDERMANIKSFIWCTNILSEGNNKYTDNIIEEKKILYSFLLDGYGYIDGKLIYPLEKALKELNLYDKCKELIQYGIESNFSLAERLLYGLPITLKEYNEIQNIYNDKRKEEKNKTKLKIIIE